MKNKRKIIGSIVIAAVFVVFLITGYFINTPAKVDANKDIFVNSQTTQTKDSGEITVYINGEVSKPGVYKVKSGSRIDELIKIAGGATVNADTQKLNFAKKLKDEDYIFVNNKITSVNGAATSGAATSTISTSAEKININIATKEELKTIPGVGDVTSQKIIDYREKNGDFKTIEDLKKIGGFGDKSLEKVKDKIDIR